MPAIDEDEDGDNNPALLPVVLLAVVVVEVDGAEAGMSLVLPPLVPPLEELSPLCLDSVDVDD